MWSTPSSTARRSTASAASRSRGGPKTPGPASCIAPNPIRPTGRPPNMEVLDVVMPPPCATVTRATRRASILGAAPPPSETRRAELAEFLKHRRALVSPASVGLEANGRRRTPGLRREEVAQLAGVGLSWYTWLEQGRDIRPSTQVLDWNSAAVRVIGEPHTAPDGRPNLLWWLFATDRPRSEQWRDTARNTLARFRAEHARRIGDPDFAALIEALEAASPDLRLTQFAPADDTTRATLQALR